jgi:hypothetical protein
VRGADDDPAVPTLGGLKEKKEGKNNKTKHLKDEMKT